MKKNNLIAYLFIAPSLIIFLLFMWLPLIFTFFISFYDWKITGNPEFLGFKNYFQIFKDGLFFIALKNTLIYTLGVVPVGLLLSFFLAIILNKNLKGKIIFRSVYFFPAVVSYVVVSLAWQWMYGTDFGIINSLISMFSASPVNWLSNPKTAMLAIIIMSIWKNLGYNMVIFLAGLQGIPEFTYEAAKIDGVNSWQKLIKITLPLMKPTILFVVIIAMINSFKVFDQVFIMTGGGPGYSSMVLVHYIYRMAFQFSKMGYACAVGIIFFLIILIFTLFQFKFFKLEEIH
ncbi:MAG: sugar ABC transporter permease [Armatimonadetes bacterium]|nr:sugar ABC transporter permease [Armatimonadota bacterium]